jgi:ribonuclease P protein component
LPRHEADLSTEEAAQEPHARFYEAFQHAGRAQRLEASARKGAQAPHHQRAEEVAGRVKLEKAARLRRRRQFLEVQQRGRRVYSGDVLVLALGSGASRPRIGITVSSKVGNAVERNQVKRWVREAWRMIQPDLPALDLVVIARPSAKAMGLAGARRALEAARAALAAPGGRP